jgi:hypothetical protein
MGNGLRPLTTKEVEAFRTRNYTLANCGVFYLRGLVDACGRDQEAGRKLRAEIQSKSEE